MRARPQFTLVEVSSYSYAVLRAQTLLIRASDEAYAHRGAIPRDFGGNPPCVSGISKCLKWQTRSRQQSWTDLVTREPHKHRPCNLSWPIAVMFSHVLGIMFRLPTYIDCPKFRRCKFRRLRDLFMPKNLFYFSYFLLWHFIHFPNLFFFSWEIFVWFRKV